MHRSTLFYLSQCDDFKFILLFGSFSTEIEFMCIIKVRIMLEEHSILYKSVFERPSIDALYDKICESSLQFYAFSYESGESSLRVYYEIVNFGTKIFVTLF